MALIVSQDSGKLTTDHRKVMNELVDDVNAQIVGLDAPTFFWSRFD